MEDTCINCEKTPVELKAGPLTISDYCLKCLATFIHVYTHINRLNERLNLSPAQCKEVAIVLYELGLKHSPANQAIERLN